MANIIYHIPWKIKEGRKSATGIRPLEMLKAFRVLGNSVDVVMGDSKERYHCIKNIKSKIEAGYKYDLIYSESSVAPTFIASGWRDYLKYGNIDFIFLKFCRKRGVPLTLFYRDIYWKFPQYISESSFVKRSIMKIGYKLDLLWYKKWVNILYLPSQLMERLLGKHNIKVLELPPGGNPGVGTSQTKSSNKVLTLFYVGGATGRYKLHKLFSVVSKLDSVKLRFCTREKEWNDVKHEYVMSSNIEVIHKSGKELDQEYQNCDIAILFFEPDGYIAFPMPFKLFEYVSYLKPMIATAGTSAGEWIKKNSAGWVLPYAEEDLRVLLEDLINHRENIDKIKAGLNDIKKNNLWSSRAKQVIKDVM